MKFLSHDLSDIKNLKDREFRNWGEFFNQIYPMLLCNNSFRLYMHDKCLTVDIKDVINFDHYTEITISSSIKVIDHTPIELEEFKRLIRKLHNTYTADTCMIDIKLDMTGQPCTIEVALIGYTDIDKWLVSYGFIGYKHSTLIDEFESNVYESQILIDNYTVNTPVTEYYKVTKDDPFTHVVNHQLVSKESVTVSDFIKAIKKKFKDTHNCTPDNVFNTRNNVHLIFKQKGE